MLLLPRAFALLNPVQPRSAEAVANVLALVACLVPGLFDVSVDGLGLVPGLGVGVGDFARPASLVSQVLGVWVVRYWEVLWCGTICTCGMHYRAVAVGFNQPGFG